MTHIEWYLLAISAVGVIIWARGWVKRSPSSAALGLLLGVVAAIGYFVAFNLTRTNYLAVWFLAPFLVVLVPLHDRVHTTAGKALCGVAIVLVAAAALVEYKLVSMGNAMLVIEPYRAGKQWRFDEPLLHLKAEPFVQGMSEMIDLRHEQDGGNWYYNEQHHMEAWLCPALFKFFPRAPQHIYARVEAKE